ncbi:Golgi SNAP receptor complex member 1-like isoform X3 [Lineus longissimus]|uniref:Golgi SNAP receptor complex member 1-like isoform X3 n=1 Tax=Lineus longissimus TaxID=88925 RepID=UPI00315C5D8A
MGRCDTLQTQFSDLRKQARQLENEIDLKLVSFSKLGTNYSAVKDYGGSANSGVQQTKLESDKTSSDTSPLLNKSSSEHMFETMAMEIEQLLARLTEVNDRMADFTQNVSMNAGSSALLHTLQRHRDILQDYSHEFQKTKVNISAFRDREDLLGSVRRDIDAYKNASGLNRRTELYLKEHEHLRSSDRLIDDQINVALATKENLLSQRGTFYNISQKMSNFTSRFPVINNLVTKINFRKRRDTIIIACVVALCLILLLIYQFH